MSKQLTISDFIKPIAVNSAQFFVNDMFMSKFGSPAPDRGYHLVAFYNGSLAQKITANCCYL